MVIFRPDVYVYYLKRQIEFVQNLSKPPKKYQKGKFGPDVSNTMRVSPKRPIHRWETIEKKNLNATSRSYKVNSSILEVICTILILFQYI